MQMSLSIIVASFLVTPNWGSLPSMDSVQSDNQVILVDRLPSRQYQTAFPAIEDYEAAEVLVEEAITTGQSEFYLTLKNGVLLTNLEVLPPEIGQLAAVKSLVLRGTNVVSIAALQRLDGLEYLHLSMPLVTDISPLQGLVNIRELELYSTDLDDLSALSEMKSLVSLRLNHTNVSDLEPLRGLANLEYLLLHFTAVDELGALSGLHSLEALGLDGTSVSNLEPIKDLLSLEVLWLKDTQVTDISALQGISGLRLLWLEGTGISDIEAVASLENLERIALRGTQVRDLSPLKTLSKLYFVQLPDGEHIGDTNNHDEGRRLVREMLDTL